MTIAVVASAYGGPEVLAVVDEELGAPGLGQILVEVRAAAANPADSKMYSGAFGRDPSKLPIRLGLEAAGVVIAVGEDAEGPAGAVHAGDDVIAYRIQGGYASQVMVPASAVVPKPSTLSFEEASGLLLAGATAAHCLGGPGADPGTDIRNRARLTLAQLTESGKSASESQLPSRSSKPRPPTGSSRGATPRERSSSSPSTRSPPNTILGNTAGSDATERRRRDPRWISLIRRRLQRRMGSGRRQLRSLTGEELWDKLETP